MKIKQIALYLALRWPGSRKFGPRVKKFGHPCRRGLFCTDKVQHFLCCILQFYHPFMFKTKNIFWESQFF